MFSSLMATFFSNMMPWLVFAWCLSAYFFIYILKRDVDKKLFTVTGTNIIRPIRENTLKLGIAAIIITVIYLLCPIRSCILARARKAKALEFNVEYESLALTFPNHYDRENPLTHDEGSKRLLQMHIKKAEENGDKEQVKALEAQKE